jgi:hypothetical protein
MPPKKERNRIETKDKVEGTSTGRKRDGGWSAGRHGTSQLDTSRQGKLRQGMREVVEKVFSGTSQTSPEEPKARTEPSGISEPTGGLINLRESASSPGEGTQYAQQEERGLKRIRIEPAVRESKKARTEPSGISGYTGGLVDFGENTSAQPERGLKRIRIEPAGIAQASSEAQKEQIQKETAEEDISPARKRIKLEPLAKNITPDSATGSSESKKPNFEPTQEDYGLLADITEHEINIAIRKLTDHTEKDEKATNSKYRLEKAGRYINGQDLRKCLQSNPEKTMIDILKKGDPTRIASGLILKEILRAKKEEEWHKKGEEWHKKNFISTVREGCKTFGEVRTTISKVCTDMLDITGNNTDTIEDNLKTLNTQDGQIEGIISSIYEAYKGLKWAKGPQFPGNSTPKLSGQDLADQTPAPKGPLNKETIPFERLMAVARKSGL